MSKQKKIENYIEWFVNNKELINLSKVSQQTGIDLRTIRFFVNGQRKLPAKWKQPLADWVKTFVKV